MPPRVRTGDRDAVLRQIRWCAAVQTLVNCHCQLEENPVGNVEPMKCTCMCVYVVKDANTETAKTAAEYRRRTAITSQTDAVKPAPI